MKFVDLCVNGAPNTKLVIGSVSNGNSFSFNPFKDKTANYILDLLEKGIDVKLIPSTAEIVLEQINQHINNCVQLEETPTIKNLLVYLEKTTALMPFVAECRRCFIPN